MKNLLLAFSLIFQFIVVHSTYVHADERKIVRHPLCEQAVVEGYPLAVSEVLSQGASKRTVYVPELKTEIDILLLNGIYPPYHYGHALLGEAFSGLKGNERVLVLGVGSGYDVTVLKKRFPGLSVEATDISQKAVINAELNLAFHNVNDVRVYQSDVFSDVKGKFDIIMLNAPRSIPIPQGVTAEPGDEARFDLGGYVIGKFLEGLAVHLNHDGTAFLMTNSETQFGPEFNAQRLTTSSWDRHNPSAGSFGIFSLKPVGH